MKLSEQLEAYRYDPENQLSNKQEVILDKHIQRHRHSSLAKGLNIGDKAPDFMVNREHQLYDYLAKGPVVLSFIRGSWSPYCTLQLGAYEAIRESLNELNTSLLFLTLQDPENYSDLMEGHELHHTVVNDRNAAIADNYDVLYTLDEELIDTYKSLGISLDVENTDGQWHLPTTVTFIIDTHGLIRHKYLNEDYRSRMEPQQILAILEVIQ